MTLIGITLISAVSHAAENKPLVTLLEEYPLRQQISAWRRSPAHRNPPWRKGKLPIFLRRNPDQVNQFFQTYQSNGTTQLHLSVLLRVLLMAARSGEKQFLQETQSHLATVVESLIRQGGRMFANLQEMDLVAESQQILGFSNLYLWANYVEEQGIEYHWQDQQENTEHLQRYETEILEWIRERVYSGIEERSSPYYLFSLAALLNVRDITTQENLRTVSDGFIDILLADIAQSRSVHARGAPAVVRLRRFPRCRAHVCIILCLISLLRWRITHNGTGLLFISAARAISRRRCWYGWGEEIRSEGRSRSKIIFPVTEKSSIGILWRSIHMLLPDIFWDPFNYGMNRYPGSPDPGICLCMLMERSIIYSLFWMISSSAGASHRIPRSIFSGTAPRSNTRIFSISSLTEDRNGEVPSLP